MEKQIRVLFVDDEPNIRVTMPAVLAMHGFQVTAVATVGEALDVIQRESFDVLLSDLNIGQPGDGFTVVSAMRRIQPEAVTIIITGFPAFETALEAIRAQVDDYVVKPTNPDQLVRTIHTKLQEAVRKPRGKLTLMRVWEVLQEHRAAIVAEWLQEVEAHPELAMVPLGRRERADHVPEVLDEVIRMLRAGAGAEVTRGALRAAAKHGVVRRQQKYTVLLVLEESRILRQVLARVVQRNLLALEISSVISDLMHAEDSMDLQTTESVRAFLAADVEPRVA